MDNELQQKIEALEAKIEEMYKILKSAKRIFIWSVVISLALFVIPLIILLIILPGMIGTLTSAYPGL